MALYRCGEKWRDKFNQSQDYGCGFTREQPWDNEPCPNCGGYVRCTIVRHSDLGDGSLAEGLEGFKPLPRIPTNVPAFDKILQANLDANGNPEGREGMVPGSTHLVGGPPGVGKSTLMVQIARGVARDGRHVIYASGEDTRESVIAYAYRLGVVAEDARRITVLGSKEGGGHIDRVVEEAEKRKAKLIIADSLQTADCDDVNASEGSGSQINAVMNTITSWAKKHKLCSIVLSHLNKAGDFAGTRTVLHLVDTLIRFDPVPELDEEGFELPIEKLRFRELSIAEGKHRGGTADINSFLEMTKQGLKPAVRSKLIHLVR